MNIDSAFPSDNLKASDLQGRSFTLTMGDVKMGEIGDDKKPILHFQDAEKPLVLNKTNANTIAEVYGTETNNWFGQKIEIYPSETDYQGKRVPCIRVRRPMQQAAPAAQAPMGQTAGNGGLDDEIPFAPLRDLP